MHAKPKNTVNTHNKSALKSRTPTGNTNHRTCNCRNKQEHPLNKQCLTKSIIYQAAVKRAENDHTETYIGLCETTFKTYNTFIVIVIVMGYVRSNLKASFKRKQRSNHTAFCKHIWQLKDSEADDSIK